MTRALVLYVALVLTAPAPVFGQASRKTTVGKDGSEMVLIPGGRFDMGTDRSQFPKTVLWMKGLYPGRTQDPDAFEDETPRRRVRLDAFYLDRYEVTNAQYRSFVLATKHREPEGMAIVQSEGKFTTNTAFRPWSDPNFNRDKQPVVCVSRDDARAYCQWAGKRLPTEAEWERAARGGLARKEFTWGDDWPPPKAAGNFAEEAFKKVFTENRFPAFTGYDDGWVFPAPVGTFRSNAYGLFDMAGNVSEWVQKDYGNAYYGRSPLESPTGRRSGQRAITRGGSWFYKWAYVIRVANREDGPASWRAFDQGFRCALSE